MIPLQVDWLFRSKNVPFLIFKKHQRKQQRGQELDVIRQTSEVQLNAALITEKQTITTKYHSVIVTMEIANVQQMLHRCSSISWVGRT